MNLASIPANVPFLESLATAWLAAHADPSRGLILLPTRRAARSLADAFLRAGNGRPMLLPRITALGALDETPLALAGALALPPAVAAAPRLAGLAKLILRMPSDLGGATTIDQAWRLAVELAKLMDEADRAEL
ncbi:MAG: double-strand break repair protein AddB, partial [Acetobacteraceae bacterium]|nr:double-strand break repair protein AddB [Acetobacteraceae bacterium]